MRNPRCSTLPAEVQTSRWRQYILPASIAAAGVGLVLVNTWHWGPGLTQDSAIYVSTARSLLAGRGFIGFDGAPLVTWPPLFPLLLAGLGRLGIEPVKGALVTNTLAYGLVVFLAGIVLARSVRDRALVAIGTTAVMVSHGFFGAAIFAWSEPLFALLLALLALSFGTLSGQNPTPTFLAIILLTALAPLQRYVGLAMIPASALAILACREVAAKLRIRYALLLGLVASLPIGLWFWRNLRLAGTLSGQRPGVFAAVGQSGLAISRAILKWFIPGPTAVALDAFGVVLVVTGVAVTVWLAFSAVRRRHGRGPSQVRFALVTLAAYTAALLTMVSGEGLTQLERLMAPVFFLAVLLLTTAAERAIELPGRNPKRRRPIRVLVLAVCILSLVHPVLQLAGATRHDLRFGLGGFESREWKANQVILWLKAHPLPGRILSNQPAAVYFLAGTEARMSPQQDDNPERLRRTGAVAKGDYLVWFRNVGRPNLMLPEELNRQFGLQMVVSTADGGVAVFR